MKIIKEKIILNELQTMSQKMFGGLVKTVVDLEQEIMVIDADMHVDEEQLLLENGSKQENLWGINLYPTNFGQNDFIEFDSMINLRPSQNNFSRRVENKELQEKITKLIEKLVTK